LGIKDEIHTLKDEDSSLSRWSREEFHGIGARRIGVIGESILGCKPSRSNF